ncbi:MAG: flagellar hook-associated protein FlgK [Clostridiales bacterium]|jgi:flagellar hook-associated protein 1 FlgK|nr:flagellar hook-associated protein FlgK [Clostridiales bacterium]
MKSSFFEFHVANTALFTARGNLQVTNHNIANAQTEGFSRQYAMQRTNTPINLYNGKGMVGTGSEVYGVGQIRDIYLDKKYWSERAVLGEYTAKQVQLNAVETLFNDFSENGLTGAFNDFFAKMQSLAENSGDPTYRTNLIQSANSIISLVNLQANALRKQQADINTEVKAVLERVNSLGEQIVSLNRQIATNEVDGSKANDLRDARARLVDELSLYVNVEVKEREMNEDYAAGKYPSPDDNNKSEKRFSVSINGYEFVDHFNIAKLECRPKSLYNPDDPAALDCAHNEMDELGLYDIYFTNGSKFNIYSPSLQGELKGLIDLRDGNNTFTDIKNTRGDIISYDTSYKGIPHYLNRLNDLVRTFARAINEGLDRNGEAMPGVIGHVQGSTRENPPVDGMRFFTIASDTPGVDAVTTGPIADYNELNVFNFIINPEIINDPYKIAAANPGADGPSDESDNSVILSLLKIRDNTHLFKEGKLADYINAISSELGIDINQATKFEKNYTDVTTTINNQRLSVSGVDINEEITNMIKYHQLFQASAKLINVINSIYNTLINTVGV